MVGVCIDQGPLLLLGRRILDQDRRARRRLVVRIDLHLLALAGLVLAGCAAAQRPPVNRATPVETARVQQLLAERSATTVSSRTMAPRDRLRIQVANLDELSGEFTVAK